MRAVGIGDARAERLERAVIEHRGEPHRHAGRGSTQPRVQHVGRDGGTWMAHAAAPRAALSCLAMGTLSISAGDLHFTGQWVEGFDRTIAAIRQMLPMRNRLIHVRWSGEGCWVPLGDIQLDIPPENATSHPAPGELIVYPGGLSECEVLLATARSTSRARWASWRATISRRSRPASTSCGSWVAGASGKGPRSFASTRCPERTMSIEAHPRFELLVRGGTVVRAQGSVVADVAVRDGRIVAVAPSHPGERCRPDDRCVRAAGTAGCHRCPYPHPDRVRCGARSLLPGHCGSRVRWHDHDARLQQPGYRHQRGRPGVVAGRRP